MSDDQHMEGESVGAGRAAVDWLEHQDNWWKGIRAKEWPKLMTVSEILATPNPPEWFNREQEHQFRKGFYYGVVEAAELVATLYSKGGYTRPREIANILAEWTHELRSWRRRAIREEPLNDRSCPSLRWVSWAQVKKAVHKRDGYRCQKCGASSELEAHHIDPVSEGGLPEIGNLITLCRECHRGPAGPDLE